MKKFLAVFAVLALVCLSSMAFAADVKLGGSVDIRSRNLSNTSDFDDNKNDKSVITQNRFRFDVGVSAGDVKGKINIETDWDVLGSSGVEAYKGQVNSATVSSPTSTTVSGSKKITQLGVREAWLLTPVPGTPLYLKAGHMFLQLGNGWFFRNMKNGSDAWVVYTDMGPLHLGLVNVKVLENVAGRDDDADAYVLVATSKFGDATAGINITQVTDRTGAAVNSLYGSSFTDVDAQNIGLHFGGKVGPLKLQAEVDAQLGEAKTGTATSKLKGMQAVVQGNVAMAPVTVNFTAAYGSGPKDNSSDIDFIVTSLDADPHYTFLYEYITPGACGKVNQGFCNTTALSAGAMFAATKNLSVGADVWLLQASEKIADKTSTTGATTNEIGTEIDVKANWKLADNVTWNWTLGTLLAGKGLGKDDALGAQGVLSMKF